MLTSVKAKRPVKLPSSMAEKPVSPTPSLNLGPPTNRDTPQPP